MNPGIRRVGVAIVVLVLVLIGQLTYLQIVDAGKLAHDPRNVRAALRDINRARGPIVTADGVVVAKSVPSSGGEFKFQREYPTGSLFSQVVGYQSFVFGNLGVEKTYNDPLVGRDTELQIQNLPNLFGGKESTGKVVLSLRNAVQQVAAQQLGSQRGSVVALDVHTGQVLAMYSNPSYDPSPLAGHNSKTVQAFHTLLSVNPTKPDLARAYRELYPPGSSFKTVTASVALENGVVTPDSQFPVRTQLTLPQTTNTLKNFGGESCGGSLVESFTQSCNTTFGQIGLQLGDSFVPGMAKFGIGDSPPLDVAPGAVASQGPPAGSFRQNQPRFAFSAIGQDFVAVTPLQMALVAAGIANGGVIMAPHVVKEIRDSRNHLVRSIEDKVWRTAMSATTAQAVTAMMVSVVQRGTGTGAQIRGITVAGKTGTAQVGPNQAPDAWFVAFAPAEAPRVAVAVLVEHGGNAQREATGGRVAAPIAAAVIRAALGV